MPESPNADLDAVARQLLTDGRRIEAIRFMRVKTGIGLVEAKAYVDALERGEPGQARLPRLEGSTGHDRATRLERNLRGNAGVIVFVIAVVAVLVWMVMHPA